MYMVRTLVASFNGWSMRPHWLHRRVLWIILVLVIASIADGDGISRWRERPSLIALSGEAPRAHHVLARTAALERGAVRQQHPTGAMATPISRRRLLCAYLLWLCLPFTGAHHLYLGRNRAALLSGISLGAQQCWAALVRSIVGQQCWVCQWRVRACALGLSAFGVSTAAPPFSRP